MQSEFKTHPRDICEFSKNSHISQKRPYIRCSFKQFAIQRSLERQNTKQKVCFQLEEQRNHDWNVHRLLKLNAIWINGNPYDLHWHQVSLDTLYLSKVPNTGKILHLRNIYITQIWRMSVGIQHYGFRFQQKQLTLVWYEMRFSIPFVLGNCSDSIIFLSLFGSL